jgi:uncharacterized membrane protein YhaH (DUF805 family)
MNANQSEQLIQLSRRQLWLALVFILFLGVTAIAQLAEPDARPGVQHLWTNFPIVIIIAVAALQRSMKRAKAGASARQVQAVLDDELRRDSQQRAYRNAFFMMLLVQPVLAILMASAAVAHPIAIMACTSALSGAVTMLASLLYYDR